LTIQFSATAFIDPLLATWLVAALVAASGQGLVVGSRWPVASDKTGLGIYGQRPATSYPFWSGFFFALAVATKYQAWLFLPLLLGSAALCGWGQPQWRRWLAGFLPVLLLLALWAVARPGTPALWLTQLDNFGGIRPVWSWELWPRLKAWLTWGQLALGSPFLAGALIVSLFLLLFRSWRCHDRAAGFDLLFILYGLSYFLLHWLLAVPVWDRYLLPLMPVVGLILGRGVAQVNIDHFFSPQERGQACPGRETGYNTARFFAWLERGWGRQAKSRPLSGHHLLLCLLLLLSWPTAVAARHGRFPIGGRPSADQGATPIAAYLVEAPYGAVLYDHWFSWQWRYLLFDRRVFVSWFPHPAALVEDLIVFGRDGQQRYLALPDAAVARPIQRAVMATGFQLHPVPIKDQAGILLYQILPQEKPK
jgi:hypothetical protein